MATIPTDTEEQKNRVEKLKKMSPAHIAPLVAYLASEEAQDISGQIFGVRGKRDFPFFAAPPDPFDYSPLRGLDGGTIGRNI